MDAAYAEIVVTIPVEGRFHYSIPVHLRGALEIGHRVLVPFGKRRITGFVSGLSHEVDPELKDKVRPIEERLDIDPLLPMDVLALATFAADYYLAPVGEVLKLALPPGITAASKARIYSTPAARNFFELNHHVLPDGTRIGTAQRRVLEAVMKASGAAAKDLNAKAVLELEAMGLVIRKDVVGAKDTHGEIEVLEKSERDAVKIEVTLGRSRARRSVWDLLSSGPMPADEITDALEEDLEPRTVKEALKTLEKEGLIARRKTAPIAESSDTTVPFAGVREVGPELMPEQTTALDAINGALEAGVGAAFLLHGVTGSGKTEVYLRAIASVRAANRGAIILVPEIALTPQLESRFRARFGDDVTVLHSALTDTERRKRWLRLRRGEAHIALGPRSAVWAPVKDLGIIVVDEEHDASFKQGSDVRYHGRDLALTRAFRAKGVAVLGSATPSLETMQLVRTGRMRELRMKHRALNRPMPVIQIVDLVEERRHQKKGEPHVLSRALADRLRSVVAAKEQAILFLNRRGFNTVIFCEECGEAKTCANCSVSMTYHKQGNGYLACHYCGRNESMDAPCSKCKSQAIRPFGVGTQRVVEAVREEAPDARVLRLDRDVTSRVGELERTLAAFRDGEADVLVGTQMVAKGHDFPRVTLVGVLLADASLAFPDFRAAERTFQLLTQVSGRAGRAESPGHVVIQTFQRGHYAIEAAVAHDSDRFFEIETESRQSANYPPFSRIGVLRFEARDEHNVKSAAAQSKAIITRIAKDPEIRIRGPVPAPIARIRERYRYMLMVFAPSPAKLTSVMRRARAEILNANLRADIYWDVDPNDLL